MFREIGWGLYMTSVRYYWLAEKLGAKWALAEDEQRKQLLQRLSDAAFRSHQSCYHGTSEPKLCELLYMAYMGHIQLFGKGPS